MVNTKDQGRSPASVARRWAMPVVSALAVIGLTYPVSVGAVVTIETYSDVTCSLVYDDAGLTEQWTSARGPDIEYLPNPGYTCTYLVDEEWITMREELPEAKDFAFGASFAVAAVAVAGLVVYYRRQQTPDSLL